MKRFLLLAAFSIAVQLQAAPAIVHRYNVTTAPVTLTAVGTNNTIVAAIDASVTPASVHITGGTGGTQTLVQQGAPLINASSHVTWFILKTTGASAGETSLTCTTCGTVNAVHAWEISGTDTTNTLDHIVFCNNPSGSCAQNSGSGTHTGAITYNPGFSAEAVLLAGNCSGSAASPFVTGTGITWTAAGPNGEPGADGITSSAGTITGTPDSGCANTGVSILGVKGSGSTQACTWDVSYNDDIGQGGASGSLTIAGTVGEVGDLVIATPWCINTCSVTTMTVGSDTMTQAVAGNSDASNGQPRIYYDIASASGAQNIVFTPGGTFTHFQITYYDFVPSGGCTITHDVDAGVGTGTGTTTNTPSITATAGDLEFNFSAVFLHVSTVNSPWVCTAFTSSGANLDCTMRNTFDADAYILNASGSSTANNITNISSSAWQALMTSFKLTGNSVTCDNRIVLLGAGCG